MLSDCFLTHDDADHYNGIRTIIGRFRPKRLWLPYRRSKKKGFEDLLQAAKQFDVAVKIPDTDVIVDSEHGRLSVLGYETPNRSGKTSYDSEDDSGLILRLESNGISVIFPGDISRFRESTLVKSADNLKATFLVSAHHGSVTSNSFEFLDTVSPEYLIVSAGASRPEHFPSQETRTRAEKLGIHVLTTAQYGTITVSAPLDSSYRLTHYEAMGGNYWRDREIPLNEN